VIGGAALEEQAMDQPVATDDDPQVQLPELVAVGEIPQRGAHDRIVVGDGAGEHAAPGERAQLGLGDDAQQRRRGQRAQRRHRLRARRQAAHVHAQPVEVPEDDDPLRRALVEEVAVEHDRAGLRPERQLREQPARLRRAADVQRHGRARLLQRDRDVVVHGLRARRLRVGRLHVGDDAVLVAAGSRECEGPGE
jgi:hypothetical protein